MIKLNSDRSESSIRSSSNTSVPSCKSPRHRRCSSTGGQVCLVRGASADSAHQSGGGPGSPRRARADQADLYFSSCYVAAGGSRSRHASLAEDFREHQSLLLEEAATQQHIVDVESLQFNLRDVQRQVSERDERVSLLLQQLSTLEKDCARDISRCNANAERSKRQVKRLKRECDKYKKGLGVGKSLDGLTDSQHGTSSPPAADNADGGRCLQQDTERWKLQFEEVRSRMCNMEQETEELRRALHLPVPVVARSDSDCEGQQSQQQSPLLQAALDTAPSGMAVEERVSMPRLSAGGGSAPCLYQSEELDKEDAEQLGMDDDIRELEHSSPSLSSLLLPRPQQDCRSTDSACSAMGGDDDSSTTISDDTITASSPQQQLAQNEQQPRLVVESLLCEAIGGATGAAAEQAETREEGEAEAIGTGTPDDGGDLTTSVERWSDSAVHSVKDLDELKCQLQNAKCEASETQTQLKYKIKELEDDVKRYRTMSPSGRDKSQPGTPDSRERQDRELDLWDPQELIGGDVDSALMQANCDLDAETRGDVAQANDELRRRVRELEALIEQFKSQQSELGTHIVQMEMLSQEVELLKQATARASRSSGATSTRLHDALQQERALSRERLQALCAKDREVEACHRELQDLTKHMSSLSLDLSKLTGRMKMQKTESMMHKESADELQRALRHKCNAMDHKDDEIRLLREKLDDATVVNAKTRAEVLRLQQELDTRDSRSTATLSELEQARVELAEQRERIRREKDELRREAATLEYERDRAMDELETAKLRIGELSEDVKKLRELLRSNETAYAETSYELQEVRRREDDAARELHALRCDLHAAESDACSKSAEVEELLGQRERLEAVCSKQRERMQQLVRELTAAYETQQLMRRAGDATAAAQATGGGGALAQECDRNRCLSEGCRAAEISLLLDKLTAENSELRKMLDTLAREMADNILPRLSTMNGGSREDVLVQQMQRPQTANANPAGGGAPAGGRFDLRSKLEHFILSTNSSEDTIVTPPPPGYCWSEPPTPPPPADDSPASELILQARQRNAALKEDVGRSIEQIRQALESAAVPSAAAAIGTGGGGAFDCPVTAQPGYHQHHQQHFQSASAQQQPGHHQQQQSAQQQTPPPPRQPHSWDGVLANKQPGPGSRQADIQTGRLDGGTLQEEFQTCVMDQRQPQQQQQQQQPPQVCCCTKTVAFAIQNIYDTNDVFNADSVVCCGPGGCTCGVLQVGDVTHQEAPFGNKDDTVSPGVGGLAYDTADMEIVKHTREIPPERELDFQETERVVDRGVEVLNRYLDLKSKIMEHLVEEEGLNTVVVPATVAPSQPRQLQEDESGICVIYTNERRIFRSEEDCKVERSKSPIFRGRTPVRDEHRTKQEQHLLEALTHKDERPTCAVRSSAATVAAACSSTEPDANKDYHATGDFEDLGCSGLLHLTSSDGRTSAADESDAAAAATEPPAGTVLALREHEPDAKPYSALDFERTMAAPQRPQNLARNRAARNRLLRDREEAAATAAAAQDTSGAESQASSDMTGVSNARQTRVFGRVEHRSRITEDRSISRRIAATNIDTVRPPAGGVLSASPSPSPSPFGPSPAVSPYSASPACSSPASSACASSATPPPPSSAGKMRRLRRQLVRTQRQLDSERRYNEMLLREYDRDSALLRQLRNGKVAMRKNSARVITSRYHTEQKAIALQNQQNKVTALANTVSCLQQKLNRHASRRRSMSPSKNQSIDSASDVGKHRSPARRSKKMKAAAAAAASEQRGNQLNYSLFDVKFDKQTNSAKLAKAKLLKYKNVNGKMMMKRSIQLAQNRLAQQRFQQASQMLEGEEATDDTGSCSLRHGQSGQMPQPAFFTEGGQANDAVFEENPLPSLMTSIAITAMSTSLVLKLKPEHKATTSTRKNFD